MATKHKVKYVKGEAVIQVKRKMSAARRARLSKMMKEKWAAKRAAAAVVATPTVPSAVSHPSKMEETTVDFKLGFMKGIMFAVSALEE